VRESIKTENAGRDGYPPGAAGGRDLYLVTKQEKLNKGGISKRKKERKKRRDQIYQKSASFNLCVTRNVTEITQRLPPPLFSI
jgi:hypothetical protein